MTIIKFSLFFFLLPVAAIIFARAPCFPTRTTGITVTDNELHDMCKKVVSKTEEVMEEADNLVLSRVMRFVDHALVLLSL